MSWGYKMMFTFIAFALMMSYLVYRCFGANFELVSKDYYKDELRYQQVIDGSDRANTLSSAVTIKQVASGIVLQLPEEMKNKSISGSVLFYCAYNSKKDKLIPLNINSDGNQFFSNEQLTNETYTMKINWISEGSNYYSEKNIIIR